MGEEAGRDWQGAKVADAPLRVQRRLRAPAKLTAQALSLWLALPAVADPAGDMAAFLLGLRDQRVFAEAETVIPLNNVWSLPAVTRLGPGRYKAERRDGMIRLEADGTSPEPCVYRVRFVFKTASLIDNEEVWTLDLRAADLAVERKTSGLMPGIGLMVKGTKAFCFKSSLRADACVDQQLFDDHTPNGGDEDLERKSRELATAIGKLKEAGCGRW